MLPNRVMTSNIEGKKYTFIAGRDRGCFQGGMLYPFFCALLLNGLVI